VVHGAYVVRGPRTAVACAYLQRQQAKVSSGTPVLPTGSAFITELKEFRSQSPDYVSQIGFIGGELKFVVIDVTLSLQQFLPNYVTKPVFEVRRAVCDSGLSVAHVGAMAIYAENASLHQQPRCQRACVAGPCAADVAVLDVDADGARTGTQLLLACG